MLTYCVDRSLIGPLTVAQMLKKFSVSYGNSKFITIFKSDHLIISQLN